MAQISFLTGSALALAFAGVVAVGPALAEKPTWAGEKGGKGHGDEQGEGRGASRERDHRIEHFGDPQRFAVRDYYAGQYQSGRCPPGLAKKHNGCMPPGHARKWELGYRLPQDVIYYEVPRPLVLQLGQPTAGYRYVRVAGDILMIAAGTALVVDAIRDLGR